MKTCIYEIINDPLPKLFKIKNIKNDNYDFNYEDDMVKLLNNNFNMEKLSAEHFYAMSFTNSLTLKAILQLNIGDKDSVDINKRDLAIGLLLTGAERFYIFHNHPGGAKQISKEDIKITNEIRELAKIIGIDFEKHIMITKDYWCECEFKDNKLPFS